MKTNLITLILLVFFFTGSEIFAQRLDVTWGPKIDSKAKIDIDNVIGQDDAGFYLLKSEQKGFGAGRRKVPYIEKCDFNCKPVFSEELNFPAPDGKDLKDMKLEDIMLVNNQVTVFSSFYNKKADYNYAFSFKLDGRGRPEKGFTEVDKIAADKKNNNGSFGFVLSKDSTKILVFHNEPYEKKESEKFAIKVVDKDMTALWERDVILPYKDKDVTIENWTLNNDGKVYVLIKYQEGKREKKGGRPNYNYIIMSYVDAKSKPVEYSLSLGKDFISDLTFNIAPKGDLICAGFYSEKGSMYSDGAFYMRISGETQELLSKNQKEFDQKTREKLMRKGAAKKGREIPNIVMRDLIMKEDGGAVLVGEQYYVVVVTTHSKYGTTTTYHYYYNSILAVNVNPDGNIVWVAAVPKVQHSVNDGGYYSSYAMATYGDKIILVYNDHKKNLTINDPKKIKQMGKLKKTNAVAVIIDGTGNYSKAPLLDSKTTKGVYCRPKVSLQSASNKLILIAKKKNGDYMLGTVSFQ